MLSMTGNTKPSGQSMGAASATRQDMDLVVLPEKGGKEPARGPKAENGNLHR
tara:strand:- start:2925 stop:3080 length:156 start_codon:yes stop_codon:yes gene_type:complete